MENKVKVNSIIVVDGKSLVELEEVVTGEKKVVDLEKIWEDKRERGIKGVDKGKCTDGIVVYIKDNKETIKVGECEVKKMEITPNYFEVGIDARLNLKASDMRLLYRIAFTLGTLGLCQGRVRTYINIDCSGVSRLELNEDGWKEMYSLYGYSISVDKKINIVGELDALICSMEDIEIRKGSIDKLYVNADMYIRTEVKVKNLITKAKHYIELKCHTINRQPVELNIDSLWIVMTDRSFILEETQKGLEETLKYIKCKRIYIKEHAEFKKKWIMHDDEKIIRKIGNEITKRGLILVTSSNLYERCDENFKSSIRRIGSLEEANRVAERAAKLGIENIPMLIKGEDWSIMEDLKDVENRWRTIMNNYK